ncbi:MAG: divergent polysaccharide deacetylase family protein [Proteobacteria bacterium]|nr:divergent polysaccharide deacetylase family protein [Pseudomonadota bacterium]
MPSRKKRVPSPVSIKGLVIFFLLVIAFCGYVFYCISPVADRDKVDHITSRDIPSKTIPEVIDNSPSCQRINERIYRSCKKLGVSERGFTILERHQVHRKGQKWFYTKGKIFLPKEIDLTRAAHDISRELHGVKALAAKWDKDRDDRGFLSISLKGVLTHFFTIMHSPPRLAIIIDDIGEDIKTTREFLNLGIPLTLSILPDLSCSKESEELAHNRGYEVMLHLPMEPKDIRNHNPGEGAIYTCMDENEISNTIIRHINKFKYIKGVNNHMGSLVTENEQTMRWVLKTLKPTGLYFIDSRTSSRSVAFKIAHEMKIPSGKNEIFIDNEPEINYCKNFIDKAIQRVKKEGKGIIIGHPRETTLQALREINSKIQDEGIALVFVSELVL